MKVKVKEKIMIPERQFVFTDFYVSNKCWQLQKSAGSNEISLVV